MTEALPDPLVLQALAVTCEITGTSLSEGAARVIAQDLAAYPKDQVLGALNRCRKELKGRLTLADILSRLEDGRPSPEEAWAIAYSTLGNEDITVVWTDEITQALGVARPLENDRVAARMAFLEAYRRKVQEARDEHQPVRWIPSLGQDPHGREEVLLEAVRQGRLSAPHVAGLLPYRSEAAATVLALYKPETTKEPA